MGLKNQASYLNSCECRKKIGLPNKYGRILYGWSKYGIANDSYGIYRIAHSKHDRWTEKMKFYRPTNNQKPDQQIWRGVFRAGINAWKSLTEGERTWYKESAKPHKLYGYHYFMRLWLKSH